MHLYRGGFSNCVDAIDGGRRSDGLSTTVPNLAVRSVEASSLEGSMLGCKVIIDHSVVCYTVIFWLKSSPFAFKSAKISALRSSSEVGSALAPTGCSISRAGQVNNVVGASS
ncbi:unnamed protein product [Linum trigynum]|uniref:Uncharacterized protein n=1 Tax=Linum trigynum TaxID=586398 RepID=A0AAV2DXR2_9ROSI